ncbi:hypothetical protein [Sphingomonas sp. G-3-2-10]|uniref:hypothetical protein n=1 Tax=Sphingomonas sp. G-3-2-10 TaxID=2728838 RepID=UPI00146B073B|nr:hypothetical protein [Sphingomonas sp. G-3-2-10]NML04414.1 hypothetical protein [Sphingomonas sp. G-3-2-10]
MRLLALAFAALLAPLLTAPEAMAQRASAFDYIDVATIGDAWIERSEVLADDIVPEREGKRCDLNRGQIERMIDALKRAQALKEMRDGLGADMVIRFRRAGRTDLVAVIARPDEEGGKAHIFFGGRLAWLDPADLVQVHDVAADAGCGYPETGE